MSRSFDAIACAEALDDPNVRAFLKMIRVGEGTTDDDGYRRLFGGELVDSFDDHPRKFVTRKFGKTGKSITSSAAGAYQFLRGTWDECAKALGLRDFSPKNQDLAAVFLVWRRKALDDVRAGRVVEAIAKCAREWASLPGSPYGQPTKTLPEALRLYAGYGGLTQPAKTAPAPDFTPPQGIAAVPQQEQPMSTLNDIVNSPLTKFALAAINPILAVVPEVAKIFMDKDGTTVPERNVAAAVKIVETAQAALQDAGMDATNAQAVAEMVESSPEARQVVREAVMSNYYELVEVGGGFKDARKFLLDAGDASGGKVWDIVKVVTYAALGFLALANLVALTVYGVAMFRDNDGQLTAAMQLLGTVIQADSGSALMACGFWLGSSWGSKQKPAAA